MTGGVRRRAVSALLCLVVGGSAGCSSFSDPSPPTGVDLLTIPTPSPKADDFVDVVDNPWFALDPVPGPEVLGIATTARTEGDVTDYFAQDTRGNVWWFGRADVWLAGADGAEAGLMMAANPRVGDGYRTASGIGGDPRATVLVVTDDEVVLELVGSDGSVDERAFRRSAA
ncbi:MAG: hypothetical protein WB767_11915 [Nocardioides sp.]